MQAKRVAQTALATFLAAACLTFFLAANAAVGQAQTFNPSTTLTLPQSPEAPVSPTTPGTLPGTTAQDTTVGTNPITGAPCIGGGGSAINGGLPGAPTAPDELSDSGQNTLGLPPNTSVYGLNNQISNTTNPGAC